MKTKRWRPVWVGDMPDVFTSGEIYISPTHRLTEHLCACGCGAEVSLPLDPSDWSISFDGETLSLYPSVGNERLPCKSHYVIRRSRTIWCREVSMLDATMKRENDRAEKLDHIARKQRKKRWWRRLVATVGRREGTG